MRHVFAWVDARMLLTLSRQSSTCLRLASLASFACRFERNQAPQITAPVSAQGITELPERLKVQPAILAGPRLWRVDRRRGLEENDIELVQRSSRCAIPLPGQCGLRLTAELGSAGMIDPDMF